MKTYLALERAAQLSGLTGDQLKLLCEAGRLVSKPSDDGWFIAEDELVETLATMNREVVLAELEELARAKRADHHFESTETQGAALRQAAGGVLAICLIILAAAGFNLHLTTPSGERLAAGVNLAYQQAGEAAAVVPLSSRQAAGLVFAGWQSQLAAGLDEARARLQANLHALILAN